jgi:hypothetical protein
LRRSSGGFNRLGPQPPGPSTARAERSAISPKQSS